MGPVVKLLPRHRRRGRHAGISEEEKRREVKEVEEYKPKGGFHDGPAHKWYVLSLIYVVEVESFPRSCYSCLQVHITCCHSDRHPCCHWD